MEAILYILISFAGYVSLGDDTPQQITDRPKLSGGDYLMLIGVIGMTFVVLIGMPLQLNPARVQVFVSFKIKTTGLNHILISLGIFYLSAVFAILVPSIYTVFALMGGTVTTLIAFTMPGAIGYSLSKTLSGKIINLSLTIFFTLVGLACTVLILLNEFKVICLPINTEPCSS